MEQHRGEAVQSVARALDLLELLAASPTALGVSELGTRSSLPYATIHRLLATLVDRGYVRQETRTRKYLLGSRLVRLGVSANRLLEPWARPYLVELVEASGETANLAVLESGYAVYVAQVPSRHMVRMFVEVGKRVEPHSTAVGKVLLAYRPRKLAERVADRTGLPAITPRTISDRQRFFDELDTVASQGYAVDDEEHELGVCCVAVPVFGIADAVMAMSVAGPSGRMGPGRREALVADMRRISAALSASFSANAGG